MSTQAIRRKDQRRAHRPVDDWYTACAKQLSVSWVRIPLADVPRGDQCPRCFPQADA